MSLRDAEFSVLRQTIASRGTVRMALLPVTLIAWGVLATLVLGYTVIQPLAALFPLAILTAGFEAIHALHVGVERIGRYLQVFYEEGAGDPRWETTAMAVGPALPGGGVDPLFTGVFVAAVVLNLLPALLTRPPAGALVVLGVLHTAFVVRVLRARIAAARQRAVELESFRALRS